MRSIILTTALALLVFARAHAAPLQTLTLIPSNGTVAGQAGMVVGWGYDITNTDPNDWVLLEDSYVAGDLSSGLYGSYVDYISLNAFVIDPSSSTGPVAFSQGISGVGEFDISQFAPITTITGEINIDYAIYSGGDPTTDPNAVFIGPGLLTASAQVDVVPEPSAIVMMTGAALLALSVVWRRKARHS